MNLIIRNGIEIETYGERREIQSSSNTFLKTMKSHFEHYK